MIGIDIPLCMDVYGCTAIEHTLLSTSSHAAQRDNMLQVQNRIEDSLKKKNSFKLSHLATSKY